MVIQEIEIHGKSKEKGSAKIHISIDGKEYTLLSCGTTVNVITGHAYLFRSLGKCFWEVKDILTHYKKHGKELYEYAVKVLELGK